MIEKIQTLCACTHGSDTQVAEEEQKGAKSHTEPTLARVERKPKKMLKNVQRMVAMPVKLEAAQAAEEEQKGPQSHTEPTRSPEERKPNPPRSLLGLMSQRKRNPLRPLIFHHWIIRRPAGRTYPADVPRKKWRRAARLSCFSIKPAVAPAAELMPVGAKPQTAPNGFRKMRATVDSGATMSTGSRGMAPGYEVKPSAMSRAGQRFVTADDTEVANEGEVLLPTFSNELVRTNQRWQIADIAKPLLSVGEECDSNQWVVFTKRFGFIHSLSTGATRYFEREEDGSFGIDMWVPPPVPPSEPGLPGRGM